MDQVQHEVAFLGRHVHWTLHEVLGLDHDERRRWVRETRQAINDDEDGR